MHWKERQDWLKEMYPLTVVMDRYNGTYSGAKFLAFPLDFDVVPMEVNGSDTECAYFWKNYEEPVGKGASAQEAIDDLIVQVKGEDQQTLDDLRNTIRYAASGNGVHISEDLEQRYVAWLNMVKELLDNKQKKGAWSEKEENIIGYIRHILNDHAFEHDGLDVNGDYCTDEYAQADDFLKSLRPQPHKVSMKDAIKFSDLEYERGVKDGIESEKSHHWKPTEEQMEALERTIHLANFGLEVDRRKALKSLDEQLKKLMED